MYRHAGVHEDALVDAVEAVDLAILVGEQPLPVEGRLGDVPAEVGSVLEFVAHVRGVGEQLLRDAADVHAGTAEAAGLGDRDARAEIGGDAAGAYPAGPSAYREKVVIELQENAGTT